ncbi:hypothetical protein [Planomonospora parontospora]|uniref:hypothetical protein n=1 Tax=Planomonospora parontospora TaxID=58119 RepID=UPI00166FBCE4|nr:hypothetical protein [Planomonospora parontospora]GGL56649.1 hypothetical protein GCM10014719_67580 [Planomonospora parontospora subsp. antibiotica]GII19948.1 hypothetical protein Ppa05_66740 [Planomonospora parontospora subsp. antibiotica]
MTPAKKIGPPKGVAASTEAARMATLGGRFSDASPASTPSSDTGVPTSYTPPKRRRGEPAGMTRRTYYLPTQVAEDLDAAVEQLLAATAGRATKHEALAAILTAGCRQAPTLAAGLRAALLAELAAQQEADQ